MSTLEVKAIAAPSGYDLQMPAGHIVQVVQGFTTDIFTTTSSSFTDITGLSASITPKSTSNKILVSFNTHISGSTTSGHTVMLRCLRGSTVIGAGVGASNRVPASGLLYSKYTYTVENKSYEYLDSPNTTSATTYKVQIVPENGATAVVNKSSQDGDYTYHGRFASTITLMEVQG